MGREARRRGKHSNLDAIKDTESTPTGELDGGLPDAPLEKNFQTNVGIGKETKIGLAVIALLLLLFAFVLYKRFKGSEPVAAATTTTSDSGKKSKRNKPTSSATSDRARQPAPADLGLGAVPEQEPQAPASEPSESTPAATDPAQDPASISANAAAGQSMIPPYDPNHSAVPWDTAQAQSYDPFQAAPDPAQAAFDQYGQPLPADVAPAGEAPAADVQPPPGTLATENPLRPTADPGFAGAGHSVAGEPAAQVADQAQLSEPANIANDPAAQYEDPLPVTQPYAEPSAAPVTAAAGSTGGFQSQPLDQPVAATPEGRECVVQADDNFFTISQSLYGEGAYFRALHQHNKQQFPRATMIRPGDVLYAPELAILQRDYPELCPKPRSGPLDRRPIRASATQQLPVAGRTYVVTDGDTLFDIARYELGNAIRWAEIYELNSQVLGEDFNHLMPGTELVLPAGAAPAPVAGQPWSSMQR